MPPNKFADPNHFDHPIVGDNGKVGSIRVKPNGVLWSPKGAKGSKKWKGVTLDEFERWIMKHGTWQKQ